MKWSARGKPYRLPWLTGSYSRDVAGMGTLGLVADQPDGRVAEAEVIRSIPLLDDAALAAVTQWEYRPTLLNGVAVPIATTVTVNFQLR